MSEDHISFAAMKTKESLQKRENQAGSPSVNSLPKFSSLFFSCTVNMDDRHR